MPTPQRHRPRAAIGAVVATLLIVALTLVPDWNLATSHVDPTCVLCGSRGTPDILLNVLLFVPLGAALGRLGWRPLLAAGIALMLSGGIELLQVLLPGRSPTWRDILTNAVGGGLGALVATRLMFWMAPGRGAIIRGWSVAVTAVAAVALTAALLVPAPNESTYFAHLSPRQGHLEQWSGTVLDVDVDGVVVAGGRIRRADLVLNALARGAPIRITAVAGRPSSKLAGILTISDADRDEVLLIGSFGGDLVVRERRRAADLRLNAPDNRFADLLAPVPVGERLDIQVWGEPGRPCASVNGEGRCAPRLSAGSLWTLLYWRGEWPEELRRFLDAVTLLALALPLGLLLRSMPRSQAISTVAVLVIGIAAVASLGNLRVALPEVTGLSLGLASGLLRSRVEPES